MGIEWEATDRYWRTGGAWWFMIKRGYPPHVVCEADKTYALYSFKGDASRLIAGPFDTLDAAKAAAELIAATMED